MSSRTIAVGDAGVAFGLTERGEGAPILYLHGLFDSSENPLTAALAATRRVLAPDLPGFGASRGESELSELGDAVLALLDLVDALDLGPVPVVGHCLGGMLAAELALLQPARFTPLVLLAPFGAWDDGDPGLDLFTATPDELALVLFGSLARPTDVAWSAIGIGPPDVSLFSEATAIEQRLARARALAAAARFLWPIPDRGLIRRAHRLPPRTLFVLGEEDGLCPPGPLRDLVGRAATAELVELRGAGHLVHLSAPSEVNELVRRFLSDL